MIGCGVVVALHAPDPVVGAVLEIAHAAVRVAHRPAGDQLLAEIGNIVAVNILQVDRFCAVLYDHTAAVADQCRRNAEVLSKDRKLVRLPVVVGVFANFDAVATLARRRLQLVRIVNRFADP